MKFAVKIPRGTCRLFGAIKAISSIKNSAIIVHGPKGCVYHINYIMGMRGDGPSEIYSTCLEENDVIFGAEDTLKSAIEELDTRLKPDLLFVLSCCASSIIGEDVEGAVREARTTARVIGIESGGFEGDFRTGYSETLKKLVYELVQPSNTIIENSVNLIGLLRGGPDLRELKRILAMSGVTVNGVLTADSTRSDLESLGSAALNIVLCEAAGKDAAEMLLQRCNTPYIVDEIPIGYAATKRFQKDITDALGLPATREISGLREAYAGCSLEKRKVGIISGPTRAVSMTRFFMEQGIEPKVVVSDFDSGTREKLLQLVGPGCSVLIEPEHEEIVQALKDRDVDLLIGGMLERPIATKLGIAHLDMMHGSQKTVGYAGTECLLKMLCKIELQSPSNTNKI